MNTEATDPTFGLRPASKPPFDAAQIGGRRGQILLAREQQSDIDRHTGKDRFLDSRQSFFGARDFDEQVWPPGAGKKISRGPQRTLRVIRQQGRYFERYPPVYRIRPVVNRAKQIRRPGDVLQGEIEKELLAGSACCQSHPDRAIV